MLKSVAFSVANPSSDLNTDPIGRMLVIWILYVPDLFRFDKYPDPVGNVQGIQVDPDIQRIREFISWFMH